MRTELELLADAARSEAKRWGPTPLNLIHVALAVQRRWPDEFGEAFGEAAAAALRAAAIRGEAVGDEAAVTALIERADGPEPVARVVHELRAAIRDDLLAEQEPNAENPPAPVTATGDAGTAGAQAAVSGPIPERSSRFVELVDAADIVLGREYVVDEIIALLGRRSPATPMVAGSSGSGRTRLMAALAARLNQPGYAGPLAGRPVVRLKPEAVIANDRASAVRRALEDVDASSILVIDDLDVIAVLGSPGGDVEMLSVIRSAVKSPEHRIVIVIDDAFLPRLSALDRELAEEVTRVDLPELSRPVLTAIAAPAASELAAYHRVTIPTEVTTLALAPPGSGDSRRHPGLFFDRLDSACARAALRQDRTLTSVDLALDRSPELRVPDAELLADRLRTRVLGQDDALRRIARRLTLTRAQLDLRPGRPDGVFLLVGPSGVGKTELARAVCSEVFGGESHLIRLDMSEYAHDWALSRLIGPQPGFVGFTEPESWLTTRVARQPDTLLLLDEIEKAHPTVWNAFLQVFDAGRLSDSRGNAADFSNVVVMMTSNLGAGAFRANAMGFAPADPDHSSDQRRVLEAVRTAMPPEFVNRLDEVLVFQPLTESAIRRIAQKELDQLVDRLAERGILARLDNEVVEVLAKAGYDPHFGARHLQRNIERLLLEPLAGMNERTVAAAVHNGEIVWSVDGTDHPITVPAAGAG